MLGNENLPGYSAILYFHPNELRIDFLQGIGNVLAEEDT